MSIKKPLINYKINCGPGRSYPHVGILMFAWTFGMSIGLIGSKIFFLFPLISTGLAFTYTHVIYQYIRERKVKDRCISYLFNDAENFLKYVYILFAMSLFLGGLGNFFEFSGQIDNAVLTLASSGVFYLLISHRYSRKHLEIG